MVNQFNFESKILILTLSKHTRIFAAVSLKHFRTRYSYFTAAPYTITRQHSGHTPQPQKLARGCRNGRRDRCAET